MLLRFAFDDIFDRSNIVDSKRVGCSEGGDDESNELAVLIEFVEFVFEQVESHRHAWIGRNRMQVLDSNAEPTGQRGVRIVTGFRDDSRQRQTSHPFLHGAWRDFLNAKFSPVQIGNRPTDREDAPGGFRVVKDQIGQSGDRLNFKLV